jgi:hypothetical protein
MQEVSQLQFPVIYYIISLLPEFIIDVQEANPASTVSKGKEIVPMMGNIPMYGRDQYLITIIQIKIQIKPPPKLNFFF